MALKKNVIEEICSSSELNKTLKQRWNEGADTAELAKLCADAGLEVSADEIEALLSAVQAKRGETISLAEIDPAQLERVAGGAAPGLCTVYYACHNTFQECRISNNCQFNEQCQEDAGCGYTAQVYFCTNSGTRTRCNSFYYGCSQDLTSF